MKLIVTDTPDLMINRCPDDVQVITPEKAIHPCTGCYGCWTKTLGICVIHDGYEKMGALLSRCTHLILISQCCYGSVSPFVKNFLDRTLPYSHPDFSIKNGKMRHKERYDNVFFLSAYFYGKDITAKDEEIARKLIKANAENFGSPVRNICFFKSQNDMGVLCI